MTTDQPQKMTPAERADLAKLVRLRGRVAKSDIEARQAALLADAEGQLAAIYSSRDEAWADITARINKLVADADKEIAGRCRELGIPEKFRPSLSVSWYGRGENADKTRRAELRKVAETRLAANAKAAKVDIDRSTAHILTQITAAGLVTGQAHEFLESMPTVADLMPPLDMPAIDAGHRQSRTYLLASGSED